MVHSSAVHLIPRPQKSKGKGKLLLMPKSARDSARKASWRRVTKSDRYLEQIRYAVMSHPDQACSLYDIQQALRSVYRNHIKTYYVAAVVCRRDSGLMISGGKVRPN